MIRSGIEFTKRHQPRNGKSNGHSTIGRLVILRSASTRWPNKQVWQRVFAELAKDADFEEVFLDSAIVRAHQHAAGAQKKQVNKRSGARAGD